jgi:undecaprenyl-diphosphatase
MDQLIAFCAKYLVVGGPVLIAFAWLRLNNSDRRSLFLRTVTVGVLCTGMAYVAGQAYHEQRPFIQMHLKPLVDHAANNSFPSGSALYAAACAFVLYPYSRVPSILAGVVAIGVAIASVASLLHSPIDVIAAILLAALATAIGKILVRRRRTDRAAVPQLGRGRRANITR